MRHPIAKAAIAAAAALLLASTALAQPEVEEEEMAPGATGSASDAAPAGAIDEYVSPVYQATAPGRIEQVRTAAAALTQAVQGSSSPAKARLVCLLDKVKDPQVDDRLIEWHRICPISSMGGLMGDSRCSIAGVQKDLLLDLLGGDDPNVDEADQKLHLAAHVRSLVLVLGRQASGPGAAQSVSQLESFDLDVRTAVAELAKVPSDSPLTHYVALKRWVAARRQDANSLYNLCPLGG